MKFISVKCPECGAELSISEERKFCFCEYCGTKIMCINENEHKHTHNHTYTRVDEADLIRAETERIVALNNEKEKAALRSKNRKKTLGCVGSVLKFFCKTAVVIVLLFLVLVGIIALSAGPEELGFVGLGAAGILYLMWDHRKGKKE